jgi:hypothetical protein
MSASDRLSSELSAEGAESAFREAVEHRLRMRAGISSFESEDAANDVLGAVVVAMTLGPLVTSFCTELGKRLGGSTAEWAARVHLHRKTNKSSEVLLSVDTGREITSIEVGDDLPDEARLALLDLDIEKDGVRGRRLRWDAEAGAWVAVDGRS